MTNYENDQLIYNCLIHLELNRLKTKKSIEGTNMDIELRDGDLVIMGGTTQKTHKHEIPKCVCDEEIVSFIKGFRRFKC